MEHLERCYGEAVRPVCPRLRQALCCLPVDVQRSVSEIRLRTGRPVGLWGSGSQWFLTSGGGVSAQPERGLLATKEDLQESFRELCSYSVYSYQEQIREGFVTIRGGHRVGVCGTAVQREGKVSGIRDVSSLNIRVAREVKGCAEKLILRAGTLSGGLLLAGPPASGKTTLLRDLAAQLSNGLCGPMRKVAIVDERGEICGTHMGVPAWAGAFADVLDGFPKVEGILLAVRSLSPEFIICDELGGLGEAEALIQSLNAGAAVIASIHAGSFQDLLNRPQARALLACGAFSRVALLDRGAPGQLKDLKKAGDLLAQVDRGAVPAVRRSGGGVPAIA